MLRHFIPIMILVLTVAAQQSTPGDHSHESFVMSGTIVSAVTDQPLCDIEVATGVVGLPGGKKIKTGKQGRFVFDGLSKGKYWLMAQGHGFPRQTYDEHEGFSSAIAVGSDVVSSEGIVFRLRPGASISGSVTDDFNDVVRNASVTLFHSGVFNGKQMTTMAQQVNTDDQGHYHFGHLPSGNYFVAVSAQPWYAQNGPRFQMVSTTTRSADGTTRTTQRQVEQTSDSVKDPLDVAYPITFYAGTTEKGSATSIVVKPGDHAEADVTITAVPAVHLHIQQAGAPTNDSYSTLSQHLFGNFSVPVPAQTFRNSRGDLELRGVAPGQFTLDSQINGPNPVTSSQEITVYQNGEIGAAKLSPSITVHGVVTMDGKPVSPGVFVQLRSDNTGYGNRVSDKGEFQISEPIKPGSYEIVIFGITGGAIISSVTRDTLPAVDGNRIEPNGSGPVQLDIKVPTPCTWHL